MLHKYRISGAGLKQVLTQLIWFTVEQIRKGGKPPTVETAYFGTDSIGGKSIHIELSYETETEQKPEESTGPKMIDRVHQITVTVRYELGSNVDGFCQSISIAGGEVVRVSPISEYSALIHWREPRKTP